MKSKTPSFVAEFELNIDNAAASTLLSRFEAARQVYNACLGESLRRWDRLKDSEAYKVVKSMPRTVKEKPNAARKEAFGKAREKYACSEYALHSYAVQFGKSWLGDHLDANTIQKIASRAFRSVNEYAMGKRGKPRFKGKNRPMKSVEGKSNAAGIRFKDNQILWTGLVLTLIIDASEPVHQHALSHRVKYVRLLWREIFGRKRWFAQLICEGLPYRKPKNVVTEGVVGLDIGPSTIAIVSDEQADLKRFADEISDKAKEIAKLQRTIDRQKRANNPDNYAPDQWVKNKNGHWKHKKGKNKKGKQKWVVSQRQQKNQAKLRESHRKLAAHRKSLHGKLANEILSQGTTVKTEKISYKAFQSMFGKSVGKRAPGMFVEMLRRKAGNAGGEVIEFSTHKTRLSQTCHSCGTIHQKKLSERWHICNCGIIAQRDLYSAFLATCIENDRLVAPLANSLWESRLPLLQTAASRTKSVIGQACLSTVAPLARQNGSSVNSVTHGEIGLHDQGALLFPEPHRL
jgi:putative transposase